MNRFSRRVVLGGLGIYGMGAGLVHAGGLINAGHGGELTVGEMRNFTLHPVPRPVPLLPFIDGRGATVKLADFRGKAVLVNMWATWCGPCRREMPGLDRLQADMGGDDFQVVAISTDRGGIPVAKKFLDDVGAKNLAPYNDRQAKLMRALGARGLPLTTLVDPAGFEIGRLAGPAKWDSEEAKNLIRHFMTDPTAPVET